MLLETFTRPVLHYWPWILVSLVLFWLLRNKFNNGLQKYPGPPVAGFTNLWRFFAILGRKGHEVHHALHKKYGNVVRIGPNFLLFNDPDAINDIYGLKKGFVKTQFYQVQNATTKGHRIQSLFSSIDEDYHSKFRRCVNGAFAMSTLVSYEPLVDKTILTFLEQSRKHFMIPTKTCDFAEWLQFYAFDVIGEITWSKRLGFVERNEDVDGIIKFIAGFMEYSAPIGQMPWLDYWFFDKNPVKMFLARWNLWNAHSPVAKFAMDRAIERQGEDAALAKVKDDSSTTDDKTDAFADVERGTDFLTRFKASQKAHPEFMTDFQVLTATVSLIFAGSDTTAATLSAVFYLVLKHPHVYTKLMAELDAAQDSGLIPADSPTVSWAASQKLPYLDAVVQEAFRMHPAIALPPERHVPPQGATIAGRLVPGGTIVGINAYAVQRDTGVFGDDAEAFRPERWLEATPEQLKQMKAGMFQFGAGARTCIGRHISTLEVYKLVPSFLRMFEIEFVDPNKEWNLINVWFVRVEGFHVRFRERTGRGAANGAE